MRRRGITGSGRRSGRTGIISLVLALWLVIGAVACVQRGYFKANNTSCATVGTNVVTILAGPLNYVGVNPKVHRCSLPQPSK
ncbi:MAG: hypothetical protein ABI912_02935 [Actinomycetota bacterium]